MCHSFNNLTNETIIPCVVTPITTSEISDQAISSETANTAVTLGTV